MQIKAVERTDEHFITKHHQILSMRNDVQIQVVFLGDSLTRRWEDNIDLWDKFFSAYNPANFGVGMDCLENILWRITHGQLEGIDPQIIIVLGGTNNLDQNTEEYIVSGIRQIVTAIQDQLPYTRIVLLGLLPRVPDASGIDYREKITRINQALERAYAHSDVYYRDIGADLVGEDGLVSETIMPDGLHLNHQGYRVVGPLLVDIIEELWGAASTQAAESV